MNQREQFEAWAKGQYAWGFLSIIERETIWLAWKAAQAQQRVRTTTAQHKRGCASLTRMLLSDPPKPAACDCQPSQAQQATTAQEPVAIYSGHRLTPEETKEFWGFADAPLPAGTRLYTHPAPQHKPLSKDGVQAVLTEAVRGGKLSWMGFSRDSDGQYTIPILSPYHYQIARAIEKAHGIEAAITKEKP